MKINRTTRDSGTIYAEALAEACAPSGADPVRVLTDTDDYPQIVHAIEQAEFLVGWFHGAAEALGVQVETLWEAVAPARAPEPPRPKRARAPVKPRRSPGAKPGASRKSRRAKTAAPPAPTSAKAITAALAAAPAADAGAQARAVLKTLRARRAA